jgi:hypothetical protein
MPDARQGETRTHGFFYRPTGREEGLLGLPVLSQPGPASDMAAAGRAASVRIAFLRHRDLGFTALGAWPQGRRTQQDDACKASAASTGTAMHGPSSWVRACWP